MNIALYVAAALTMALVAVHSILGEHYILIPLLGRADLPVLFGSTEFTIRTLRFAWHITSIAMLGFAALLFLLARDAVSPASVGLTAGATMIAAGLLALVISRGMHPAWLVLLSIGGIALVAARSH